MKKVISISEQFAIGKVLDVSEYGSGIVNDTYLVENTSGQKFILQKQHELIGKEVLEDIEAVTKRLESSDILTPKLIRNNSGELYIEKEGYIWRVLTFVEGKSYEKLSDLQLVKSAGEIIGNFHCSLIGFQYHFKHEIPQFHDTEYIISKLQNITSKNQGNKEYQQLNQLSDYINNEHKSVRGVLDHLPDRIIHGDLKLSNIRFNENQTKAICLLDLDTLGRNKIVIDLGDAIRSFCNTQNKFDLEIFRSLMEGYFNSVSFLTHEEIDHIPAGIKTIVLELAARYITDAIEEKYFKLEEMKFPTLYVQNTTKAQSLISL
ncbi:MAG TPA: phosphotransferase, partial [Thermodesulfobacteriota bacterium]|nr:phosphotransferase [Thermodesulfobacteriota bacterium]